MGCFRTGVRPVEQLSFETRLKRDELDCFGVGGLFCVSARSVHVCGPFLLPIFRWGIDSSSSPPSASDGPSGEAAGMEANKRRLTLELASTLQRWAEGLAVKGVSMLRSGQTAIDREADEGRG